RLEAAERVVAVVVIARCDDDAQVRAVMLRAGTPVRSGENHLMVDTDDEFMRRGSLRPCSDGETTTVAGITQKDCASNWVADSTLNSRRLETTWYHDGSVAK